jgi:hypothetical protein
LLAQHRTLDFAAHVAALRYFARMNVNLAAVAIGIFNGRSVDHAIQPGPKRGAHAHGARLAGGVKRITGQRNALELLRGQANGSHLGMRTGIELASHSIERAQQNFAAGRMNDRRAKGNGTLGSERTRCKDNQCRHAFFVQRSMALITMPTWIFARFRSASCSSR